jgi:hypothetical protein
VVPCKAGRGYPLASRRTDAPLTRLKPARNAGKVQALWWNGQRRAAAGRSGIAAMALDVAPEHIALEPRSWTSA